MTALGGSNYPPRMFIEPSALSAFGITSELEPYCRGTYADGKFVRSDVQAVEDGKPLWLLRAITREDVFGEVKAVQVDLVVPSATKPDVSKDDPQNVIRVMQANGIEPAAFKVALQQAKNNG